MGATGGTRDSHELSNQVLFQLQTVSMSPPGYQHPTNYTTSRKTSKTCSLSAAILWLRGRYVPLRETAEAPLPSRPPPPSSSSSSLYEWSLSPVANYCHSTHPPWKKCSVVNSVLLCTGTSPRKQEAFLGAMHGRRRGLPVLRAGCIHPSAPAAAPPPLPLIGPGSGSLRRDDCRISLYIRFSSFMILHKLIQLDNQREKLTHVS